jgi:small subunit ribosomal protein S20
VANIKSQIKRNRQNNKRRLRNRVDRGAARAAIKDARVAIDSGVPESKAALMQAISLLDKAAEKGVIHKNNAARRKSRLMKAYAKMEPANKVEVEPVKAEPVAEKPKKAAPRKRTAKIEEPKAEVVTEPKAEPKKTTVKKTAAKKTATTPKKTTAKKK